MRMGIGIGWPNASAQITPLGYTYFETASFCSSLETPGTTQAVLKGTYNVGDYVYSPTINSRIQLGETTSEPGATIYNITGTAYNSCEI